MPDKNNEITAIGPSPKRPSSSSAPSSDLKDRLKRLRSGKSKSASRRALDKKAGPKPPRPAPPSAPPLPGAPSRVASGEDTAKPPAPTEEPPKAVAEVSAKPSTPPPPPEAPPMLEAETVESAVVSGPEPELEDGPDLRLDISSVAFKPPSEVSQLIEARRSASQLIAVKPDTEESEPEESEPEESEPEESEPEESEEQPALELAEADEALAGLFDDEDEDEPAPELTGRERRRTRRSMTDLFVFLHEGSRSHLCQAMDISRSGVRLQPPDATINTGEMVRLTFDIDSHEVQTTARIAAIHPDGSLGLQMLALSRIDLKYIGRYVDAKPDAEEEDIVPEPLDRDSKFLAESMTASGLYQVGTMLTALKEREAKAEEEIEEMKSGLWPMPKEGEEAEAATAENEDVEVTPTPLAASRYGEGGMDRRNIAIYVLCGVVALLAGLLIFSRDEPAANANVAQAPAETPAPAPVVDLDRVRAQTAVDLARRDVLWSTHHAASRVEAATATESADATAPRALTLSTLPEEHVLKQGEIVVCESAPCDLQLMGGETLTLEAKPAPVVKKKTRKKRKKRREKKKKDTDPFSISTD